MIINNYLDLGLLVVIVTILIYQLTQFNNSIKPNVRDIPRFRRTPTDRTNDYGEIIYDIYDFSRGEIKKMYYTKIVEYYLAYLFPICISLLAIISIFFVFIDMVYIPLVITLMVSTILLSILMNVAIKIWNIGLN